MLIDLQQATDGSLASDPSDMSRLSHSAAVAQSLLLAVVVFALCATLIAVAATDAGTRMAFDHERHHLPTVLHFLRGGDIYDYPAAMTPGYHLLLAGIAHLTGAGEVGLRIASALLTSAFLFVLGCLWARSTRPVGAWLALPAVVSLYVLPAGVWLLPDNLAWLTVLSILWISVLPGWRASHVATLALLCLAAVFVRQSSAWIFAPVLVAAFAGAGRRWPIRMRALASAVALGPATVALAALVWYWGGLTPPSFQAAHESVSPSAPAFFLFLFFAYGVWYTPVFREGLRSVALHPGARRLCAAGGVLGGLSAAVAANGYSVEAGRFSGLWNVVRMTPTIGERSLLILTGAVAGGALLVALLSRVDSSRRWVIGASVLGFCGAQASNHYVFERYYAGFVLVLLALIASATPGGESKSDAWSFAGIGCLVVLNAWITGMSIW